MRGTKGYTRSFDYSSHKTRGYPRAFYLWPLFCPRLQGSLQFFFDAVSHLGCDVAVAEGDFMVSDHNTEIDVFMSQLQHAAWHSEAC